MGACVLFAALCSNMQLLFCCFVCYLEWMYLLASQRFRGGRGGGVCVPRVCRVVFERCSLVHLRSLFQLVLVVGLVWLYIYIEFRLVFSPSRGGSAVGTRLRVCAC
jgi:hypothetical protein